MADAFRYLPILLILFLPNSQTFSGPCPSQYKYGIINFPGLLDVVWYQMESTAISKQSQCITWEFNVDDDINLFLTKKYKNILFNKKFYEKSILIRTNPYTFRTLNSHWYGNTVSNSYYIQNTDNQNYIILSTCGNYLFNSYHKKQTWILTTDSSDAFMRRLKRKLNINLKLLGMDRKQFKKEPECY